LSEAPEPAEIYELTREEGERRLQRPVPEIAATAVAAVLSDRFGTKAGHFAADPVPQAHAGKSSPQQ
jgi:hypothetical protein